MATKRQKRYVYELRRGAGVGTCWRLFHRGALVGSLASLTRGGAIFEAALMLDHAARWLDQRSELVVYRINGTIGERRTYPRTTDPRRSKG